MINRGLTIGHLARWKLSLGFLTGPIKQISVGPRHGQPGNSGLVHRDTPKTPSPREGQDQEVCHLQALTEKY